MADLAEGVPVWTALKARLSFVLLALLVALPLGIGAQEKPDHPNLAYLLDGVIKLYVVDESRCAAQPNSPNAGRWYVIEDAKSLGRLRGDLAKVATSTRSGCLCGGPDIHYYGLLANGDLLYYGLDCQTALDGWEIPQTLQNLLVPLGKGFLGTPGGPTYILDVPLEIPEPEIRAKFAKADLNLLVGGWWNMFSGCLPRNCASKLHTEKTAPVYLELKVGPVRAPKSAGDDFREDERLMDKEAAGLIQKWLDRYGLTSLLLLPVEPGGGSGTLVERSYRPDCYLRDAEAVKKIIAKAQKDSSSGVGVSSVQYRSRGEMQGQAFYQAALLMPDAGVAEGIRRAKALLPAGCKITSLCERGPKEN